jgi:hypothetical protein
MTNKETCYTVFAAIPRLSMPPPAPSPHHPKCTTTTTRGKTRCTGLPILHQLHLLQAASLDWHLQLPHHRPLQTGTMHMTFGHVLCRPGPCLGRPHLRSVLPQRKLAHGCQTCDLTLVVLEYSFAIHLCKCTSLHRHMLLCHTMVHLQHHIVWIRSTISCNSMCHQLCLRLRQHLLRSL